MNKQTTFSTGDGADAWRQAHGLDRAPTKSTVCVNLDLAAIMVGREAAEAKGISFSRYVSDCVLTQLKKEKRL